MDLPWIAPAVFTAAVAILFALAFWIVLNRMHVELPLRTTRDVAWFAGIVALGVPIIAGALAQLSGVASFARVVASLSASVISLVPAAIAFARWSELRPPAEHHDPPRYELLASVAATFVVVFGGTFLAYRTQQPLLAFSFIPMCWLAIRYGSRGAALAVAAAYLAATLVNPLVAHGQVLPASLVSDFDGFLIASSLMAFLLGSLTMERWELVAKLSRRAYVDELTGLPNRDRLVEWIDGHEGSPVVLVILDIDDMRLLNQGIGRSAADRVFADMALRLRALFPPSHLIARVSAHEFSISLVDDRSPHPLMADLRAFFEVPFEIEGSRVYISVSMGAVRMARAGSADEMLRKADIALDRAKLSPTRCIVYAPEHQGEITSSLVGELHQAVVRHELVPFFQPIFRYDRHNGQWNLVGAEALLRWIHPERGIVSPAAFLDMLERLSICEHVGWNVVEQSLLQAGLWRREIPHFRIWVNLFARQSLASNCAQRIGELIESTGVPADALVVEINERIVASDERDVAGLVGRLRDMGVHTAIDDFGTGGSSLGRVRDVPAGVLKIDRSFVTRSEVDNKAKAVAATVVRLASELGMLVVAEGCENTMQLQVMLDVGCEYAQGYALGHPLPADLFAQTFLTRHLTSLTG